MPLSPGTSLGPYQINAPLGAGGMGEVYKATDTRLDRTVAIKVLPEHVANDPDLKQRFEREARTVAALNHPHICTLYDIGNQDGIDFLVMEYLDGQTLAQRLEKGALPLDQTLTVAIEIADALDKAHRQGIVHRDLKPGNIMLTKAGAKLLDFGLAKLKPVDQVGGLSAMATQSAGLTGEGKILGTLQYMAPEQLEGKEADARTDIFAFGATVYEMVTGQKAFTGESQASLIAAILDRVPVPMATLQSVTPARLDEIVTTCLAKDPDDRWQSARDVGRELSRILQGGSQATPGEAPVRQVVWRPSLATAVGVAIGLSLLSGLVVWNLTQSASPTRRADRLAVTMAEGEVLTSTYSPHVAISPDGSKIAYVAGGDGRKSLQVRPLDELAAALLTEGPVIGQPFFSWDGSWVGFHDGQDDSLNRVSTLGGPVLTICTGCVSTSLGVSWGSDDTLLFGSPRPSGLWRIASEGGEAVEITTPEAPEVNHAWPEILPGGRAALFTTLVGGFMETAQIAVVDLETGQQEVLIPGSYPRYAPTGHIVYGLAGSLWAVGFDVDQLEVSDERPIPVLDGVFTDEGGINFDFSLDGTLIYVQGPDGARSIERSLVWVDRQGAEVPLGLPDALYSDPRVSPDGMRVVVSVETPENTDIWVYEPASGARIQLTTDPAPDTAPLWSPNGDRVVFTSRRNGVNAMFLAAADGSGPAEHLLTVDDALALHAYSWSPDGNSLVFEYSTIDTLV